MAKFDITKEAEEDLFQIWEYTVDTWSEEQADQYYSVLISALNDIAAAPGKVGKAYYEILPGIRAYHVRRHRVFYVVQENGRPLIVRILHERMDYSRHLCYE